MKIAIVAPVFPPYCGGIGNVAYHQAVQLEKLGEEVTVLSPDYGQPVMAVNFKLIKIKPLFSYGNAAFLPDLPEFLAGFDIVCLHYPFFGGAEVIWRAKAKANWKLVLHYQMDLVGKGLFFWLFKIYTKIFLPKIIKAADKIVVSSFDYAKNSNLAEFLKKQPEKFMVVPNGVDLEKFRPAEKDRQLQIDYKLENNKAVLFVGGLDSAHYFKGVEYLILAFKQVAVSAKLVIVGSGDLLEKYKALARELKIEGRVIFAGKVSDSDLPRYYNLADLVVLPSIDKSEAFGIVLVEGMACDKPVVASDLAGVRSVVGEAGLLVTPKDVGDLAKKISQILNDEEMAKKMGAAGRKKVEQMYDWKIIGKELRGLYDEVGTKITNNKLQINSKH